MTLAHFYGTHYSQTAVAPGKTDMERLQYLGNESPEADRLQAFRETIQKLNEDFGTWNLPWGTVNRYQRINGDIFQPFNDSLPSIPIGLASGRWGALAAFGARYFNDTKKIYGTRGNSFVAVVEFGDTVKAKSLLAGGQSGNPKSPHFKDQEELYRMGKFKEVPFYLEDVKTQSKTVYHPGEPAN
jgi:acyl-homoserine lactone acylase PvdQ